MAELIKPWLLERKMDPSLMDHYPEHSWVAIEDEMIAAGGLCIDLPMAAVVGLVTNPSAPSDSRSLAIDLITLKIIQKAKVLGAKQILAWTGNEGILKRSFDHGFRVLPETMMILDLMGE
jgi:hypothetical protein